MATPAVDPPADQQQQHHQHRSPSPAAAGARNTPVSSVGSRSQGGGRRHELKLANGRFIIRSRLGSGSFGDIYKGFDTWRQQDVAIKLEQAKTRHPQLSFESKVYKLLHQTSHEVVGIPEVYWFGVEGDHNAMVMELCGPCLEDLFNYCLRQFTLKTVFMLADQMMHRMEYIHSKGLIHRDIKPENFVFGTFDKGHTLFVIDFGLSKRYWDGKTKSHVPFRDGKPLTGTARYCSSNAHRGYEQGRRDDLESIGYLLVYFTLGCLPWQGIAAPDAQTKTVKIGEKKIAIETEDLCKGCPPEILAYIQYCKNLKYEEAPDYAMLRDIFRAGAAREGFEYDWVFDWIAKRDIETAPVEYDVFEDYGAGGSEGNLTSLQPHLPSVVRE